jgi:hypothetical protein
MRAAADNLKQLVHVLRRVDNPALEPLIERCADIVRRTYTNPGV